MFKDFQPNLFGKDSVSNCQVGNVNWLLINYFTISVLNCQVGSVNWLLINYFTESDSRYLCILTKAEFEFENSDCFCQ